MADESASPTERDLIREVTEPLSRLPDNPLAPVADVDFPIVLRGYDRIAVDAYVRQTAQLVAELQASRSPDAAVRRALERVGEEVSGILQRAHDAAGQIGGESRREAEERLEASKREAEERLTASRREADETLSSARREADETLSSAHRDAEARLEAARREAEQIVADAHLRLRELDAETDRIWDERHQIVEDARMLASQLLSLADAAAARFPPEESLPEDVDGTDTLEATEPVAALEEAAAADLEPPAGGTTAAGPAPPAVEDPEQTAIMPPLDGELP